jgi:hypothetical protein
LVYLVILAFFSVICFAFGVHYRWPARTLPPPLRMFVLSFCLLIEGCIGLGMRVRGVPIPSFVDLLNYHWSSRIDSGRNPIFEPV